MLTDQERRIEALVSVGCSLKEAADIMGISEFTARKHYDNFKQKSEYKKATEITGDFICRHFGVSYKKFRGKIISSILTLLMMFCLSNEPQDRYSNRRITARRFYRREFTTETNAA